MKISINPVGKPRQTQSDRWKKRPVVMRYRAYADELREKWSQETEEAVPDSLFLIFQIPMPGSWSAKKKAAMMGTPHQQKPDIDNLVKAFLDALCEDDSYVWRVVAVKQWAYTGSIEISRV